MARRTRSLGIAVVVALTALFTLLPVVGAAPRTQETKNVAIQDFKFDPATLSVNVGDTVTWKNNDTAPHTATAIDHSFDSGRLNQGQEFSFTFTQAGTFQYVCSFHDQMQATIEVTAVGAAPAAQPAAPAQQAATGTLDAADQAMANNMIVVASVSAGQDGWIAVHLDEGGRPGRVIGTAPVKQGDSRDIQVQLSESVPVGGAVWPMLHVDAGTAGTYEFPGPDVPVTANGAPVMEKIMLLAANAAPAAQPAAPTSLPRTAGEELPLGAALLAALLALLAGAALRARRT